MSTNRNRVDPGPMPKSNYSSQKTEDDSYEEEVTADDPYQDEVTSHEMMGFAVTAKTWKAATGSLEEKDF